MLSPKLKSIVPSPLSSTLNSPASPSSLPPTPARPTTEPSPPP
ncbi:hypothetical protein SMAC4_13544 [Sordaria macrospora]|nr:hypothetical protein SMAC4_13544 [Sordaria macrospora]